MKNGYFIVIEGCDGSGKTTLAIYGFHVIKYSESN